MTRYKWRVGAVYIEGSPACVPLRVPLKWVKKNKQKNKAGEFASWQIFKMNKINRNRHIVNVFFQREHGETPQRTKRKMELTETERHRETLRAENNDAFGKC